jgi:two-component system KDP operon response regulator KdpE
MALEGADYAVSEAASLKQGMLQAGTRHPDLLILDLNLPDGDGIEVVKAVRTWSDMPILILSARLDESDKIQALDSGADDYLSKPFSVGELTARVRALLRRKSRTGEDASPLIEFGEVQVDFSKRTVLRRGEVVHLTPIEYKLLSALLSHPGKVITQKHCSKMFGVRHSPKAATTCESMWVTCVKNLRATPLNPSTSSPRLVWATDSTPEPS